MMGFILTISGAEDKEDISLNLRANCAELSGWLMLLAGISLITLTVLNLSLIFSFFKRIIRSLIERTFQKKMWTQKDLDFFLEHVSATRIMTALLSKQLLTVDDRNRIEDINLTEREKVKTLMKVMISKDRVKLRAFNEIVAEIYPGFRKGMSVKHRTALIKCRIDLVKDMESSEICSMLYSRGLLNVEDKEWIDAAATRGKKAERILDILPGKGDDAFSNLVEVLTKQNAGFLAQKLNKECEDNKKEEDVRKEKIQCVTSHNEIDQNENSVHVKVKNAMKNMFDEVRVRFSRKSQKPNNEKPKKKFCLKVNRNSNCTISPEKMECGKGESRRLSIVSQKRWIVTHIGTRISIEQVNSMLKKTFKDDQLFVDQETKPQMGDINDIISNLNQENFDKFLEIAKGEMSDAQNLCPFFSESPMN